LAAIEDETGKPLRIAFCPECARRELEPGPSS